MGKSCEGNNNPYETINYNIIPNSGYEVDQIIIKDEYGNLINVENNIFIMPESNVTITDVVLSDDIVIENLVIRPSSHEVTIDGVKVELTLKEFKILTKLCKTPGRVYTRDAILDELWGMDYTGDTRTVDTHIKRIRTKLNLDNTVNFDIKTVWGVGYKFEVL